MKHTFAISALALAAAMSLQAKNASDILVYINPGHGGHDANDRNVVIAPYSAGDPNGYWESNSNLDKGLALRDLLQAKGYKVKMSRTTNTTDDDLGLSTISSLANKANSDIFFSIHSNATGTTSRRNFPLMLFKGWDDGPVKPNDKVVCNILNKYLLQNKVTYWTATNINVRGDWTFYYSQWGTSGLGVLRNLTVIGMLSEGSFHDYIPETYRLMNKDFCWLEAYHFRRTVDEYFGIEGTSFGSIAGRVNDARIPRVGAYAIFGDDKMATVDGATVTLLDEAGNTVDTYTTDPVLPNGVFAFRELQPGKYKLVYEHPLYYSTEQEVTVTANEVTYANTTMNRRRLTPPEVVSYSPQWQESDEDVQCNVDIVLNFNWDMDVETTEAAFSIEPKVEGKFKWEDTNYRLVFTPDEPLAVNTVYTVTLGTGASHPDNKNLQEPFTFSFRTTNRNYMSIIGGFPQDGGLVHYNNATVEYRFDKLLNSSRILTYLSCVDEDGNKVAFNNRKLKSSKDDSAYGFFRIPFTKALTVGKKYHVTMQSELCDRDGVTLREPIDIWFTAEDAGTEKADATMIDDMDDASIYVYDVENSVDVASQSIATSTSDKLFGKSAASFTYTFPATEGSEVLWGRKEASDLIVTSANRLGAHVNGDLSGNELYLQFTSETDVQYAKICDLDFLGWKYFEIVPTTFEGDNQYKFTGIKVTQNPGQASIAGTFMLDDISIASNNDAGIDDVTVATGVSVYPNPASEYLIANAPCLISSVELVDLNGRTVATNSGNVLNVASIASGHYILIVKTGEGATSHKVVVKH